MVVGVVPLVDVGSRREDRVTTQFCVGLTHHRSTATGESKNKREKSAPLDHWYPVSNHAVVFIDPYSSHYIWFYH